MGGEGLLYPIGLSAILFTAMARLHPANDKLREAEYFFFQMQHHLQEYEFKYIVSAFLAALYSCGEHLRLFSKDPRFKDWYAEMKTTILANTDFQRLRKLRDVEIHQKGTASVQRIGMSFGEEGITITGPDSLTMTVDLRSGTPKGSYQISGMEAAVGHPVETCWIWDTADELDVMELCSKGLEVIRRLIRRRDEMKFQD
jgi:hypothetical protein